MKKLLFFLIVLLGFGGSGPASDKPGLPPRKMIQRIVVDAGHGGKDFGAIGRDGLREKDLTMDMAEKVQEDLHAFGVEVVLTRNTDVFIPLANRAKVANKKGADLFVSIHANASLNRALKGFEVYYLSEAADDQALAVERAENSVLRLEIAPEERQNKNLKVILWDLKESENRREAIRLANDVGDAAAHSIPIAARRIRAANFYVLRWTECPAVLVEMGYISNRSDENRLKNLRYRRRLSAAIVKGILHFKERFEETNGFTN